MMSSSSPHKIPMMSAMYSPASTSSGLSYGSGAPVSTPIKMGGGTKRPLQPASSAQTSAKKRIQFNSMGYVLPATPPASVARRNARERNRVKQVNMGFAVLRQHIPPAFCESTSGTASPTAQRSSAKSRKVSKVDTLRCAVEYIRSLQDLLSDSDACSDTASSSACSSSENMSPPAHLQSKSFTYGQTATSLSPSNYSDASSPTPSDYYGSEHSYYTASSQWGCANRAGNEVYDVYDAPDFAAEAVEAPNDEELLDAISWWQQSQ